MSNMPSDPAAVRQAIASFGNWYHQIELVPGVHTPGVHPSVQELGRLDHVGLPKDCRGLRVLDIGCRDGFFSFEMERRGADVVSCDYASPQATGFPIAARILDSRLQYRVRNVYNLRPEDDGLFDIVLFLGLLYHLRNPMLAIDQVRSVLKPGGLLFVTTHLVADPDLRDTKLPVWQFLPRASYDGDATNKWIPNLPGLTSALEESSLAVRDAYVPPGVDFAYVRAQAGSDDLLEYFRQLDSSEGRWGDGSLRQAMAAREKDER